MTPARGRARLRPLLAGRPGARPHHRRHRAGARDSLEDARLHAGRLEAWGRPGQGASFRLTLPRRAGVQIAEPPVSMAPASHEPGLRTGQIPVVSPSAGPTPTAIPDLSDPGGRRRRTARRPGTARRHDVEAH